MGSEKTLEPKFILYHVLNDEACAEVRRFIVEHNLTDQIVFRNIDRSDEATKDLQKLQGSLQVPFLVDHIKFYKGSAEVLQFLQGLRGAPSPFSLKLE